MCGICGLYSYGDASSGADGLSEPADGHLLGAMTDSLAHRGPDDAGHYVSRGLGLGFRRLSIIDVEGGHQPIHNEDGTVWVVFNGEIYNFRELRRELEAKGHVFRTRTDTEVIVHGYEEWGDDCVLRFNGMFAFAVWDGRARRLLLARDHFGVKPLYYHDDGRRLRWSSELKALLLDPAVPREVDTDALDLYLTFRFVPSPRTLFAGIKKLAPGHRLVADGSGVRVERYWQPHPRTETRLTESEYVELLRTRLQAAVERQMVSDVPIGALLSGGIDSAVVVAIMSRVSEAPVRTFSVGFTDGGPLNELADARATARLFGTEHHEVALASQDFVDGLSHAIECLEEPISSTAPLSLYLLCRRVREHVKVVLTGQGADEPFGGYVRYLGERYGALYRHLPEGLRHHLVEPLAGMLPRQERAKRAARSMGGSDVTARFADAYAVFPQGLKARLWRADRRPAAHDRLARDAVDYWRHGVEDLDPLLQMGYVDSRLSLADDYLIYGDKMAMASSVEARVPFLDLELMATAEGLPPRLRIRGLRRKYLYKKVVARWLPPEVIARPKRSFEAPTDRWFRGDLAPFVRRALLSPDSACPQYFDAGVVARLLDRHISGREDYRRQLFNLLVFELWHRKFVTRTEVPEAPDAPRPSPARSRA